MEGEKKTKLFGNVVPEFVTTEQVMAVKAFIRAGLKPFGEERMKEYRASIDRMIASMGEGSEAQKKVMGIKEVDEWVMFLTRWSGWVMLCAEEGRYDKVFEVDAEVKRAIRKTVSGMALQLGGGDEGKTHKATEGILSGMGTAAAILQQVRGLTVEQLLAEVMEITKEVGMTAEMNGL